MKTIFKMALAMMLCVSFSNVLAMPCPPANLVKNVKLIHAQQEPYDPDYWNFTSSPFTFHDGNWHVAFGTFFRNIKTAEQALKLGQAYFDQAALVIPHPHAVKIRGYIWFCNYMPEGHLYYLSASNPSEKNV